MRFGKIENNKFPKRFKLVAASLIFCACAISAACQTADERFDAKLKQCVESGHKNLADDIDCLEKLLKSNPDRTVVYLFLADDYRQINQLDKAEEAIKVYVQSYPSDAAGRESFCKILMEKGDLTDALTECTRAVQLEPKDVSIRLSTAAVQEKMGRMDAAEITYKDALSINPKDAAALLYLGRLYEKKGDLDKAIETFEKLVELKTDDRQKIEDGIKKLKDQRQQKQKPQTESEKDN